MSTRRTEIEELVRQVVDGVGSSISEAHVRSMVEALVVARDIEADFALDAGAARRIADSTWPAASSGTGDGVRRFLATLATSLGVGLQPVAGFRGASAGRRLTFTSEHGKVTIEIALKRRAIEGVTPDLYTLTGHWEGRALATLAVCVAPGGAARSTSVDEDGFFSLEAEGDRAVIEVHCDVGVIELPPVMLGDGAAG